jgi:hypothetical protein
MLVMCVARGAFRGYSTMEELLEISPPPEEEMYPPLGPAGAGQTVL